MRFKKDFKGLASLAVLTFLPGIYFFQRHRAYELREKLAKKNEQLDKEKS